MSGWQGQWKEGLFHACVCGAGLQQRSPSPAAGAPAPRVRAIALNTAGLDPAAAETALDQCREWTGLVCDDPVRHGGETLLAATAGLHPGTAL